MAYKGKQENKGHRIGLTSVENRDGKGMRVVGCSKRDHIPPLRAFWLVEVCLLPFLVFQINSAILVTSCLRSTRVF